MQHFCVKNSFHQASGGGLFLLFPAQLVLNFLGLDLLGKLLPSRSNLHRFWAEYTKFSSKKSAVPSRQGHPLFRCSAWSTVTIVFSSLLCKLCSCYMLLQNLQIRSVRSLHFISTAGQRSLQMHFVSEQQHTNGGKSVQQR